MMSGKHTGMGPEAVLLDVGGVFLLPDVGHLARAFAAAEIPEPSDDCFHDAHYRAAARFAVDVDVDADWVGSWRRYLEDYALACVEHLDEAVDLDELHRHLDSEFADAALWTSPIPGAAEGLRRLADTGVRLGVISNADGLMAQRLREREILQVGPGAGVEVECVIDSGDVGVMKPDPRIFRMALEAMAVEPGSAWYLGDMPAFDVVGARRADLRPWVIDPLRLHLDRDYDRVGSLEELAQRVSSAPG
ncbi:MAG: HAD family hydrolase [Ilumatobacter sp.]|nr:MAG: HAD family hydrolase [Ilumatobacter sp.]